LNGVSYCISGAIVNDHWFLIFGLSLTMSRAEWESVGKSPLDKHTTLLKGPPKPPYWNNPEIRKNRIKFLMKNENDRRLLIDMFRRTETPIRTIVDAQFKKQHAKPYNRTFYDWLTYEINRRKRKYDPYTTEKRINPNSAEIKYFEKTYGNSDLKDLKKLKWELEDAGKVTRFYGKPFRNNIEVPKTDFDPTQDQRVKTHKWKDLALHWTPGTSPGYLDASRRWNTTLLSHQPYRTGNARMIGELGTLGPDKFKEQHPLIDQDRIQRLEPIYQRLYN
jgi:hypothetical protein